jgi:hypothetical protein
MSVRTSSLLLSFVFAAAAGAARGQDPGAPPRSPEEEARALREAAENELTGPDAGLLTEEERLQRAAGLETEDTERVLRSQLLDSFYAVANRLNALNPRITAFGDFVGRWSVGSHELIEDGRNVDDRVALREVELDLRADVDPYAKAVLILALEEHEPGTYEIDVEEGYVTLETLPWGFHAQIGRFRVPFGRMNALHGHDLPQTTRPYALTDLFGEHGYVEQGVILSWLAPYVPLELKAAFLNGENQGVFAGADSDDPAWLGRAEYFLQLTNNAFISLGTSFLFGVNDAPDPLTDRPSRARQETKVWGADILIKWQWNQFQSIAVQAEVYTVDKELSATHNGPRDHGLGAYGFVQVQPFQRWYLGARYDYSDFGEGIEGNEQWAVSGWVSYYTTEFLRFRVGYEHRERRQTLGGDPDVDTVFFQLTFVFGSHPAEPFWFNR